MPAEIPVPSKTPETPVAPVQAPETNPFRARIAEGEKLAKKAEEAKNTGASSRDALQQVANPETPSGEKNDSSGYDSSYGTDDEITRVFGPKDPDQETLVDKDNDGKKPSTDNDKTKTDESKDDKGEKKVEPGDEEDNTPERIAKAVKGGYLGQDAEIDLTDISEELKIKGETPLSSEAIKNIRDQLDKLTTAFAEMSTKLENNNPDVTKPGEQQAVAETTASKQMDSAQKTFEDGLDADINNAETSEQEKKFIKAIKTGWNRETSFRKKIVKDEFRIKKDFKLLTSGDTEKFDASIKESLGIKEGSDVWNKIQEDPKFMEKMRPDVAAKLVYERIKLGQLSPKEAMNLAESDGGAEAIKGALKERKDVLEAYNSLAQAGLLKDTKTRRALGMIFFLLAFPAALASVGGGVAGKAYEQAKQAI
jgi:hypothetical protein